MTTKIRRFYWILLFKAHHLQIRALDEDGINIVWSKFRNLCVVFLKNGQIHLHYSTISLYILQMILQIIRHQLFPEIPQTQFGFTKDRGTRNAIFVLRMLSERDIQHQDLFFVSIDCQKAFENRHAEQSKMLLNTNTDKDKWSVRSAHSDQFTPVRLSEGKTNWFHVKRGVSKDAHCHRTILTYEMILNGRPKGMVINGIKINNFRYADDTVLCFSSLEVLQKLSDAVVTSSEHLRRR